MVNTLFQHFEDTLLLSDFCFPFDTSFCLDLSSFTTVGLSVVFFVFIPLEDCRAPESGLMSFVGGGGGIILEIPDLATFSLLLWDSNYVNVYTFASYVIYLLHYFLCIPSCLLAMFQPGDFLWTYLPLWIISF